MANLVHFVYVYPYKYPLCFVILSYFIWIYHSTTKVLAAAATSSQQRNRNQGTKDTIHLSLSPWSRSVCTECPLVYLTLLASNMCLWYFCIFLYDLPEKLPDIYLPAYCFWIMGQFLTKIIFFTDKEIIRNSKYSCIILHHKITGLVSYRRILWDYPAQFNTPSPQGMVLIRC